MSSTLCSLYKSSTMLASLKTPKTVHWMRNPSKMKKHFSPREVTRQANVVHCNSRPILSTILSVDHRSTAILFQPWCNQNTKWQYRLFRHCIYNGGVLAQQASVPKHGCSFGWNTDNLVESKFAFQNWQKHPVFKCQLDTVPFTGSQPKMTVWYKITSSCVVSYPNGYDKPMKLTHRNSSLHLKTQQRSLVSACMFQSGAESPSCVKHVCIRTPHYHFYLVLVGGMITFDYKFHCWLWVNWGQFGPHWISEAEYNRAGMSCLEVLQEISWNPSENVHTTDTNYQQKETHKNTQFMCTHAKYYLSRDHPWWQCSVSPENLSQDGNQHDLKAPDKACWQAAQVHIYLVSVGGMITFEYKFHCWLWVNWGQFGPHWVSGFEYNRAGMSCLEVLQTHLEAHLKAVNTQTYSQAMSQLPCVTCVFGKDLRFLLRPAKNSIHRPSSTMMTSNYCPGGDRTNFADHWICNQSIRWKWTRPQWVWVEHAFIGAVCQHSLRCGTFWTHSMCFMCTQLIFTAKVLLLVL